MNVYPVPFRIIATALLSLFLVIIGLMNLQDRAAWNVLSDGVFWTASDGGLKAAEIDPEGPGRRAGINAGDRLIAIDGQAVGNLEQYSILTGGLKRRGTATYTLERAGNLQDLTIRLELKSLFTAPVCSFVYIYNN